MDAETTRFARCFDADPGDAAAFVALERHHFQAAAWDQLVRLYERRIEAPQLEHEPRRRSELLFRLAQILEERCLQIDRALECYRDVARHAPDFRPALVQLRRIYGGREQWDLALQVAEVEAGLELAPWERVTFETEMGTLWLARLNDAEQGLAHFDRALAIDPHHGDALLGAARAQEALGHPETAAALLERALRQVAGPDRAAALVALARLEAGPLGHADRAEECYRRALSEDPRHLGALEALVALTSAKGHWELVAELQERRFGLTGGALRRLAIAHEAARLWLDRLRNPQGARLWLRRALELFPDDPVTHMALADVERLSGNKAALTRHLERTAELAGEQAPAEVLRECARLARERGDDEAAAGPLRRLLERAPDDPEVVGELAEVLAALGRHEELADALERRAALAHQDDRLRAATLTRLGRLQEERLGDMDAALAAYERALATDPDAAEAEAGLERLYRKGEAWPELRALLERASGRATGGRAGELHAALGELLLERYDDPDAARVAFEAAELADPGTLRALHGLERVALASGDEAAVLEAFEREASVTRDGERLGFLVGELVRLRESRGELEEALHWAERLASAAPDDRAALERCARLQAELGLDDELAATLERLDLLLTGDERLASRRRLGALHAQRGDSESARRAYEAILELEPNDRESLEALTPLLWELCDFSAYAAFERRRADGLAPAQRAEALGRVATLLEERLGDTEGALTLLEELADAGIASEDDEDLLCELLERRERFEELAERIATRRARLDDDDPEAADLDVRRAALLHHQLGRPADAARLLGALHTREGGEGPLREALEEALRGAGDAAGLLAILEERAAEAEPEAARAPLELEAARLLETKLGREREARERYERLEAGGGPVAAEARQHLEAMLEREGDFGGLRELLASRVEASDDPLAMHQRLAALCRDRLADAEGAIAHLEAAAALASERADLWQQLARLHEDEGRAEDLRRALEGELETGPDAERERLLRARLARLCGESDPEAATRHYERLHALDPNDPEASRFLAERFEADERHADLAALLARRLESAGEGPESVALRLRLAAVHGGPLGDLETAIAVLEPAGEAGPTLLVAAEPLADLYQRASRGPELEALCRRAADACEDASERAGWWLRLAEVLRARGAAPAAVEAYQRALADRPDAREARLALRELYRELGRSDALARLLEAELARVGGPEELPLRNELAAALEALSRPGDALVQWRRVLELDAGEVRAVEAALTLSERLGRHDEHLALLDGALARPAAPALRARRLAARARLLAGPLARPGDAVASFREALRLEPARAGWRRELRAALEAIGDWDGMLDALDEEARQLAPDARLAVYDEAARVAAEHGAPDAALPWLERLRAARPDDSELLARIADLHRGAGRPDALLRALEAELALDPEPARRLAIEHERARLYEQLGLAGRALEALEAARQNDRADRRALRELARLCGATGRHAEQADHCEALLAGTRGEERLALRREIASLARDRLSEPRRAARHLWEALGEAPPPALRRELLREFGDALRSASRSDLWARAAEAELAALDPAEAVFAERRGRLSRELACAYGSELAQPGRALVHWRSQVDGPALEDEPPAARVEAERALLDALRAAGAAVELERRLATHLEREGGSASGWLELGRLRAEALHRPAAAAAAFRRALELDPGDREALRRWRAAVERLGDFEEVARLLERELELPGEGSASERSALHRRLGEVAWRELDSTTRASRAFAAALEADPGDLRSLRALEALFESMEDWRGALDFYQSEVEVLGESEPDRRCAVWLRVAELARDHLDEPARAARAFAAAADAAPLPAQRLAEWAELHHTLGEPVRFVEVFTTWCDDASSGASAQDQLRLARVLESLGRHEIARGRLECAVELDPELGEAWDELAALRESARDAVGAADALERAAETHAGAEAARRRREAAARIAELDGARALALLERAVADDPADASAHAALTILAEGPDPARAQAAAERVLDLCGEGMTVAPVQRVDALLAGARAARGRQRLAIAERLLAAARAVAPEHPDALADHAAVLLARGEPAAARAALDLRLSLPGENPDRAMHLAQLGACLAAEGDFEAALARQREALACDESLDAAHEGAIDALCQLGRHEDAVTALRAFAGRAAEPRQTAERLARAAELELTESGRADAGLVLLREACDADPSAPAPALRLAELLLDEARDLEALETSERALEALAPDSTERAALTELRAEALERRGRGAEAAAAYREAAALDPRAARAALAAARLLRGQGEWTASADVLRAFANAHPGGDPAGLGSVLQQLGRLLAGPLEQLEAALDVYRRALDVDPERRELELALAELLSHLPACWDEALTRQREILEAEPTRTASLRALLRIAEGRGDAAGIARGLALLRALGAATPAERSRAPERLRPEEAPRTLAHPLHETVRELVRAAASELGEALGVGASSERPAAAQADPAAGFRAAVIATEGRLSAPALVPLDDEELGRTLGLLAELALEAEGVSGNGRLVNALAAGLGRRTRKRLRRILEGRVASEVTGLDASVWREQLRALAGVVAAAETGVSLRTALLAWLAPDRSEPLPPDEADVSSLVAASLEGRALLRRLVLDWIDGLSGGNACR